MKAPTLLLLPTLAAVGYGLGSATAKRPPTVPMTETATSSEPVQTQPEAPRPAGEVPPTSFAEARPRLDELSQKLQQWIPLEFHGNDRGQGKWVLEAESLFQLADETDLAGFFAELDPGDLPHQQILSFAFARLASLAPETAAAIWSDLHRRNPQIDGLRDLVSAWTKSDPAAAERWIASLDDRKAQDTALFAFLGARLEDDPAAVIARLTEVKDYSHSRSLVRRIAQHADPVSLASIADRCLAEKSKEWRDQGQLAKLLKAWHRRDPSAVLAWLAAQPEDSVQDYTVTGIFFQSDNADYPAIAKQLGPSLAGNAPLSNIAGQAWLGWIAMEGEEDAAMEWLRTHGGSVEVSRYGFNAANGWSDETFSRVLSRLIELPDESTRRQLARPILQQLEARNPKEVLALAPDLLGAAIAREGVVYSALRRLADGGDPESALHWATAHLQTVDGRQASVSSILNIWSKKEPLRALAAARDLPDSLRERGLGSVASTWARTDPDGLLQYLKTAPDPASLAPMGRSAFQSLGRTLGSPALVETALALPDAKLRETAVGGLFSGWGNSNAEAAAQALGRIEPGPMRDTALASFISSISQTDPEAAFRWAMEIGDDTKRRKNVLSEGRNWLDHDREGATRWIEASEAVPDEVKAALLKKK